MRSVYHRMKGRNQQRPPAEKQLLCDCDSSSGSRKLHKCLQKQGNFFKLSLCCWSFESRCSQASRGCPDKEDVKTSISIQSQVAAAPPSCPLATNRNKLTAGGAACQETETDDRNLTLPLRVFHMHLFKFLQIYCLEVRKKE